MASCTSETICHELQLDEPDQRRKGGFKHPPGLLKAYLDSLGLSTLCFVSLIHSDGDVVLCAAQWPFCTHPNILHKAEEEFVK